MQVILYDVFTVGYGDAVQLERTNLYIILRGQIMTVKAHPGLCIKYSRWDM